MAGAGEDDVSRGPLSYQKTVTPWLQAFSVPLMWTAECGRHSGSRILAGVQEPSTSRSRALGTAQPSRLTASSIPAAL